MQEHTIHDELGNLIERTTEETIADTIYHKRYDSTNTLIQEWTTPYIQPEPTAQERLEATEKALLDLMEVLANV